jgi:glycosyltransferase involved in cell wall biosynthesis
VLLCPAYTCPIHSTLPRVTAVHDLSFYSLPQDFDALEAMRRRLLVGASIPASAALLACSAFTKREILNRFPDARGRVHEIALGPDSALPPGPSRDAAREKLQIEGPFLLSVGSIFRRRHPLTLLRAIKGLVPRHPDLILDMVGENRTDLDLGRAVDDLGLSGRVRLSGFVPEEGLAARYAAADVGIYLSEYEGFGLPALEVLSRGVPLVTSPAPATGELFGEASLLASAQDALGIAEAVASLLADPDLRRTLVRKGHEVASRFSWAKTAQATRDVVVGVARA